MEVIKLYTTTVLCQSVSEWVLIKRGISSGKFESINQIIDTSVNNIGEDEENKKKLKFDESVDVECLLAKIAFISKTICKVKEFKVGIALPAIGTKEEQLNMARQTLYILVKEAYKDTINKFIDSMGIESFKCNENCA